MPDRGEEEMFVAGTADFIAAAEHMLETQAQPRGGSGQQSHD